MTCATCAQCHVRSFGVRDMYDRSAYDPSAGAPTGFNKKQNTTYFVITPTERWQPYALDFQYKQHFTIKVAIESATGIKTSLATRPGMGTGSSKSSSAASAA